MTDTMTDRPITDPWWTLLAKAIAPAATPVEVRSAWHAYASAAATFHATFRDGALPEVDPYYDAFERLCGACAAAPAAWRLTLARRLTAPTIRTTDGFRVDVQHLLRAVHASFGDDCPLCTDNLVRSYA